MEFEFRPMRHEDLRLLHEWLQRPHVARWWDGHETYEQVSAHYGPSIDGDEPTDHYIALLDGAPIGMVETYLISDHPEYAALVGVGEGVAGVDLFIAEETLTGQGLGTELLTRFVDEIVFARPETIACIAGPEAENAASIRVFEKAGFRAVGEFAEDGKPHVLVRRDR
jgi:RimJ/RimL family protein N-acetyltransferase